MGKLNQALTPVEPDSQDSADKEAKRLLAAQSPSLKGTAKVATKGAGGRAIGGTAVKGGARTRGGAF